MNRVVVLAICLLAVCLSSVSALRIHGARSQSKPRAESIPTPKTFFIEQFVDHFNSRDDRTYWERVLISGKTFIIVLAVSESL